MCEAFTAFAMRNLKLLQSLHCNRWQGLGTPQCLTVRTDTGTVLVGSDLGITELDPRTEQVLICFDAYKFSQQFIPSEYP